jgi:hypothetical protein
MGRDKIQTQMILKNYTLINHEELLWQ